MSIVYIMGGLQGGKEVRLVPIGHDKIKREIMIEENRVSLFALAIINIYCTMSDVYQFAAKLSHCPVYMYVCTNDM